MDPCGAIRNRGEKRLWPLSLRDQRLSAEIRMGRDEAKVTLTTYLGSISHFSDDIAGGWIDHLEYVATGGTDKLVIDEKLEIERLQQERCFCQARRT